MSSWPRSRSPSSVAGGKPRVREVAGEGNGHPSNVSPSRHKLFPNGVTTVTRRESPEMYSKDDVSYFIVDAHIALWDGRPENQRNIHGKQFIDCFYDYHRNLSPESEVWSYEEYLYYGAERLMNDLFRDGYI